MLKNRRWIGAIAIAVVGMGLAGCQTYEPSPVDLVAFERSWGLPDFEGEAWRVVAESAQNQERPNVERLSMESAVALALYGNVELRKARLDAGVADASAEFAGVWPDPELEFDLLDNLDLSEDSLIFGASLGFTIPVSGRLEVAAKQADAEAVAAWYGVAEKEWQLAGEVRQAWVKWGAVSRQVDALKAYIKEVTPLVDAAGSLADAGELANTDVRLLRVELMQRSIELMRQEHALGMERLGLIRLMGLGPNADVVLDATPGPPQELAWPIEDGDGAVLLHGHPTIRSASAAYEIAERKLEREVREQYPDLTIGPAYEREEGQDRVGLGLSLPLPLWNRNRGGIAQAKAQRERARAEVETAYQTVVTDYLAAVLRWEAAVALASATRTELTPLVEAQVADTRRLMEIGEVDVLLLNEALSAVVEARLAVIDTAAEESAAAFALDQLMNPRWVAKLPALQGDQP